MNQHSLHSTRVSLKTQRVCLQSANFSASHGASNPEVY